MKNQKSPGSDGLTDKFYKIFWNDIKHFDIRSINYSSKNGSLTELQKQGVITLLPKPNKDIEKLENWRPISLLNVDYKIATKAIANRNKPVITTIVDNSQTGFIKGRFIGENIRLLFDIIETAEEQNKKKVREKSRECHNHKPQPFPDPKRKMKPTNINKH